MFASRSAAKSQAAPTSVGRPHSFSIGSTRSSLPRSARRREDVAPPGSVTEAAAGSGPPHAPIGSQAEEPTNGIIDSVENTPSVRSVDPNDVFSSSSPRENSVNHVRPGSARHTSGRRGVPPMNLPPPSGGGENNNNNNNNNNSSPPSATAATRRMSGSRPSANTNLHHIPLVPRSSSIRARSGPSSARNNSTRQGGESSTVKPNTRATSHTSVRGSATRTVRGSSATAGRGIATNSAPKTRTPSTQSGSGAPKPPLKKKSLVPPMSHAAEENTAGDNGKANDEAERPREEIQRDPSVAALLPSSSLLEELQQTEMELLMRRSRTNRFIADLSALMEQLEHETIKNVRQAHGNFNHSTSSDRQWNFDI